MDEPRHGDSQAFAAPHEILSLLGSAGVIGANLGGLAEFTEQLPVQLRAAASFFQAERRLEALPLVQELLTTLESVGAGAVGKDLRIAVSMSLELLAARLLERADANWHASLVAVVCDLRSVCGAEPLSQNPMLSASPAPSEMNPEGAFDTQSGEPDEANRQFLPAYREALLGLLTDASSAHAEALAGVCLRASDQAANEDRARLCRSGARLFETAARCGQAGRPAIRRLAVQMEQAFREQDQVDGPKVPTGRHPGLGDDLEFSRRLLLFVGADPPAEPGDPELLAAVPVPLDRRLLANACAALADASRDDPALRARVRDAFLLLGDYERWFEAWKLDTGDAAPEAFRSTAATWSEAFAGVRGDDESALPEKLRTHLAHAEATLRRLAEDPPVERHAEGSEPGGISVDESLLEHLNLAAAEIRGVRSRAEANLGSLRGGFENMERAIKTLRGQLEALEVDAESPTGSAGSVGDMAADADSARVHERLGALSRGITELAELKDALNALTEDTESTLAAQASEDNELDEALLKTQLASAGTQFDAWTESARRAAAALGVELAVEITGAEVSLERHQADALSGALTPMLEACVREGRPRPAASADPAGAEAADIRITVSRPRFDVVVEASYSGAPLPPEIWLTHAVAFNALGAVGSQTVGPEGTVTLGVTLPGPPQAMELLVVELGESRFALPVDHLAGVSRLLRQDLENTEDGYRVHHEGQAYPLASLASLLGVAGSADPDSSERLSIVFIAEAARSFACLVDRVQGRERSLVRSPGPLLLDNPWVWGVVVNDSAPPTLVLDVAKL